MYSRFLHVDVPVFVRLDHTWWLIGATPRTEVLKTIKDDCSIPAIKLHYGIILYPMEGNNIEIG